MKPYGYEETAKKLNIRSNSYKGNSSLDLNKWIIDFLKPQKEDIILDLCCGTGNQVLIYSDICKKVIGADINKSIIDTLKHNKKNISLKIQDIDKKLHWKKETFDIVSCCYGIYYANNIENTLNEMKRVLKKGGKLFICGPTKENSIELNELHRNVSMCDISSIYNYRSERIENEVIPTLMELFNDIHTKQFINKLSFKDTESFMKYYTSSLLFKENTINEKITIENMKRTINEYIINYGEYIIYKRGIGVIAK